MKHKGAAMLKNGQTADVTITGYTSDGQGVCRMDGCAVFVPNAIAGELCTVKVVRAGKTAAWGKIERILQPSPHRIPRACPYAKLCGGCQFQHMDYEEETALKAQRVVDALTRIGKTGLRRVQVLPAPAVDGYRNKAQYPVAEVNGHPVAGFYKSRTHQVVPIDRCRILPPEADMAKDCVLAWMERWGVRAYDETTGRGLIRHIYVRKAFATGQLLVCLVA
ncbi:MAG: TRAM domain-containing protein, partial [Candidatus Faecousia sp.]|nr:TRAM domain-containing protein [Candidatus Faecousia sp.]